MKSLNEHKALEGIIQKAIDAGFVPTETGKSDVLHQFGYWCSEGVAFEAYKKNKVYYHTFWNTYKLIFNHNFAKALWGEVSTVHYPDVEHIGTPLPLWQYHLQMMVIADDPVQYLEENS